MSLEYHLAKHVIPNNKLELDQLRKQRGNLMGILDKLPSHLTSKKKIFKRLYLGMK